MTTFVITLYLMTDNVKCLCRAPWNCLSGCILKKVEDFVSRLEVLAFGAKAADHDGQIRTELERKGMPMGLNDLHISGHARSVGTDSGHQQSA